MPCYRPLHGYRSTFVNSTGKRSIVFNPKQGYVDMPLTIPCGQCIGCRLERSRQWAIRCVHEASLYDYNCFITLTYDDENLPEDKSLHLEHFQKFMKRLREEHGSGIRFFHCGEYGEGFSRPHYHAIIFNFDFKDKKIYKNSQSGDKLFTSDNLDKLWGKGFALIGSVTFESAAYVARYVTKKISGKNTEHYTRINFIDGEVLPVKPEYATMSRRPGIGRPWLDRWKTEVYPDDFVVIRGKKMRPPKSYDKIMELDFPDDFSYIKNSRINKAKEFELDNTPDRLEVKEKVKQSKAKQLKRSYENEN